MQKIPVCFTSSKSSWPCEVYGWTLTCHNPEQGLFPRHRGQGSLPARIRNSPNTLAPVSHHKPWPRNSRIPRCSVSLHKTTLIPACPYFWCEKNVKSTLAYHKCSCSKHFQVLLAKGPKKQLPKHSENTTVWLHWAFNLSLIQHGKWSSTTGCQSLCDSRY